MISLLTLLLTATPLIAADSGFSDFLQKKENQKPIVEQITAYDALIKEACAKPYTLSITKISPLGSSNKLAYLRVEANRCNTTKNYGVEYRIDANKGSVDFVLPGTSNCSPQLLQEMAASVVTKAHSILKSKDIFVADTVVSKPQTASGWSEMWSFIDNLGKKAKIDIDFLTDKKGATTYVVR